MHIRPLSEDDREGVLAIMNDAIEMRKNAVGSVLDDSSGNVWFKALMDESMVSLVLVDPSNTIIGFGNLSSYRPKRNALGHVAEISFYLDHSFTGKGWGHLLVGALETAAAERRLSVLVAILLSNNQSSKSFLKKRGYEVWTVFEDLVKFDDDSTGHLYMGKHL